MDIDIKGKITNLEKETPAKDLRVEAWDSEGIHEQYVGFGITDDNGQFVIHFDEYYYRELFVYHQPSLYFKVYAGEELLLDTQNEIVWKPTDPDVEIEISVFIPPFFFTLTDRHVYLKIERIENYSPVNPQDKAAPPRMYKRDCMRNAGHEDGLIPEAEVEARSLTAIVYREYLDAGYLIPKTNKLINSSTPTSMSLSSAIAYPEPSSMCTHIPDSIFTSGIVIRSRIPFIPTDWNTE
ncbi:MAG: hypothetical protein KDD15_24835 [Lewinella sp.]|nr:hypothetical protein [Lewinella sp.]